VLPGDRNIGVGQLVHVLEDGTAFLACAAPTDTGALRYATDVVIAAKPGGKLLVVPSTTMKMRSVPFTDQTQPLLYLAETPGFVSDVPAETSGYIRQMVGFKKGGRVSGGLALSKIACAEYTIM
jgi:hypothetical protein